LLKHGINLQAFVAIGSNSDITKKTRKEDFLFTEKNKTRKINKYEVLGKSGVWLLLTVGMRRFGKSIGSMFKRKCFGEGMDKSYE
jgi:hypothetical protein